MRRALILGLVSALGGVVGFGCSLVCADCDCGDGPFEITGVVTEADRAELVGATLRVDYAGVTISYTGTDGNAWQAMYQQDYGTK